MTARRPVTSPPTTEQTRLAAARAWHDHGCVSFV